MKLPLHETDKKIVDEVGRLLDAQQFAAAERIALNRLSEEIAMSDKRQTALIGELAGLLIDIGSNGRKAEAILYGVELMEKWKEQILKLIPDPSCYEYNLGNAKYGLYKIRLSNGNFKYGIEGVALLQEAKDHFWRAYKLCGGRSNGVWPELFVNLGNSLRDSGRFVEAIQYYDLALIEDLSFGPALFNRAYTLLWIKAVSMTYTPNMLYRIMSDYALASKSADLPQYMRDHAAKNANSSLQELMSHGYGEEAFEREVAETAKEMLDHSPFRLFCLINHLTLSEHAIYCLCSASRKDDLVIPCLTPISGEFVPRMELLLNRLKSEFAQARLLLFQSQAGEKDHWSIYDQDVVYTELFEGEYIGAQSEMLRSSLRMCFGILDKIAVGVFELFDLRNNEKNEPIYFDSFFSPNVGPKRLDEIRNGLNSQNNIALVALFSQAKDLNSKGGEWHFFKNWRNKLEHDALLIAVDFADAHDLFSLRDQILIIPEEEFRRQALHMLRFTRAAIFNFVYCVRLHAANEPGDGPAIILGPKP